MTVTSFDTPVTGLGWLNDIALFALGDGRVVSPDGTTIIAHRDAAILSCALSPDANALLTGGDDGKLNRITPDGAVVELADFAGKWVNHLAASPESKVIVAGVGKQAAVIVKETDGIAHRFTAPSTIGGIALDAKGRRLVLAHYGGAQMHFVLTATDQGQSFKWAGSHLATTISPGADYIVTAMQEPGLHGWRISDKKDLRMAGYSAKTRSFSWDRRGRFLATSGAPCGVLWPFASKDGPMGKAPTLVAERETPVTMIRFHPKEDILAIGYADGFVALADIEKPPARVWRKPTGAPVTALEWSADGRGLAAGDEAGSVIATLV